MGISLIIRLAISLSSSRSLSSLYVRNPASFGDIHVHGTFSDPWLLSHDSSLNMSLEPHSGLHGPTPLLVVSLAAFS